MFVDATFQVMPHPFYQCLIDMVFDASLKIYIPVAWILMTDKTEEWERLAQGLLEYETLTGDEIKRVMKGDPPQAGSDDGGSDSPGAGASITAIPKTKPRIKPVDDSGLEPEPTT